MMLKYLLGGLAALALAGGATVASAQYQNRDRGYVGNPLDDFLNRIGRDNTNRPLTCTVSRRLGRDGDIVSLRMDCRSSYNYGR